MSAPPRAGLLPAVTRSRRPTPTHRDAGRAGQERHPRRALNSTRGSGSRAGRAAAVAAGARASDRRLLRPSGRRRQQASSREGECCAYWTPGCGLDATLASAANRLTASGAAGRAIGQADTADAGRFRPLVRVCFVPCCPAPGMRWSAAAVKQDRRPVTWASLASSSGWCSPYGDGRSGAPPQAIKEHGHRPGRSPRRTPRALPPLQSASSGMHRPALRRVMYWRVTSSARIRALRVCDGAKEEGLGDTGTSRASTRSPHFALRRDDRAARCPRCSALKAKRQGETPLPATFLARTVAALRGPRKFARSKQATTGSLFARAMLRHHRRFRRPAENGTRGAPPSRAADRWSTRLTTFSEAPRHRCAGGLRRV